MKAVKLILIDLVRTFAGAAVATALGRTCKWVSV